MYPCKHCRLDF
jgi:hypothetical protein